MELWYPNYDVAAMMRSWMGPFVVNVGDQRKAPPEV